MSAQLGNILAGIVLTLVFFFLIGGTSLIGRLFGRKREKHKNAWQRKRYTEPTLQNLGHLF